MTTTVMEATHDGKTTHRPLRILFCVNTPWTETLGVPRVSIELARQLEMLGQRYDWWSSRNGVAIAT